MYSNNPTTHQVVLEPTDATDERTIAWLKRDLERRRAARPQATKELVSSK